MKAILAAVLLCVCQSLQKTTDMEVSSPKSCGWRHVHLQLPIVKPCVTLR